MSSLGSMPRILCWKCRKLTPAQDTWHDDFPGGLPLSANDLATLRAIVAANATPLAQARQARALPHADYGVRIRSPAYGVLLRHVNDATTSVRGRPREKELSVRLYQCPTCGRFVSEQSTECVCGVRFAAMSSSTLPCPDCGSRVPSDVDACPVCSRGFTPSGGASDYVYACPRCGVHVASDAVRCSCGAWFED